MELDFRPVTLDMKKTVESYTKPWRLANSEYTFTNMFIWGQNDKILVAERDGIMCFLLNYGGSSFMFAPLTRDRDTEYRAAIDMATDYCLSHGMEPRYSGISGTLRGVFDSLDDYQISEDRNNHDYIYAMEDLLNLSGKRYHSKRNHIHQFKARYEFEYCRVNESMLGECMEVYTSWREKKDDEQPGIRSERDAICAVLSNMGELGVVGGGIRVAGRLAAFTIGERMNSHMAVIHIEKADDELTGLYTVINQQFIEHEFTDMLFINREEDMGIEGLRRAKLSYQPVYLLEKFVGILK